MSMSIYPSADGMRAAIRDTIYSLETITSRICAGLLNETDIETELFLRAHNVHNHFDLGTLDSDIFLRVEKILCGYKVLCKTEQPQKKYDDQTLKIDTALTGLRLALKLLAKENETTAYLIKDIAATIVKNQNMHWKKCEFVEKNLEKFKKLAAIEAPASSATLIFIHARFSEALKKTNKQGNIPESAFQELNKSWARYEKICTELNEKPDQTSCDEINAIQKKRIRILSEDISI